jgi:hypothetical protein
MNSQLTNTLTINLSVAGGQKIIIGDQANLRGRKIRAILTRIAKDGNDKTSDNTVIAQNLRNAYLTLVTEKGEVQHDGLPFTLLDPSLNNGTMREFALTPIDWTKSYVSYPGLSGDDNGRKIPLVILYE